MIDELVTITATPEDGYYFDGFVIKDDNQDVIYMSQWFLHPLNTDTFTMPLSNVTVIPTFTKMNQLSIVMPQTDWFYYGNPATAYIPEGVDLLHVYDDGGKDGDYSENLTSFVRLVAPKGYGFQVTGSLIVDDEHAFWAFGSSLDEFQYYGFCAPYNGNNSMDDIFYNFIHTEELYIFLVAYGTSAAGLDLTVKLVKRENAAVSIRQEEGKAKVVIDGDYDGTDAIVIPEDIEVDDVALNRTFSTVGYSTVTLPFSIDSNYVEGAKQFLRFKAVAPNKTTGLKELQMERAWCNLPVLLDDIDQMDNLSDEEKEEKKAKVTAKCNSIPKQLFAYTPYVVQMNGPALLFNSPVTLKKTPPEVDTVVGNWKFQGTLAKKIWEEGDPELGNAYGYVAGTGEFMKVGKNSSIGALRSYLLYSPQKANNVPGVSNIQANYSVEFLPKNMDVVVVDDDEIGNEHRTVIGKFDTRTGEIKAVDADKRVYDLKGRRVNETRSVGKGRKAKGVYLKK